MGNRDVLEPIEEVNDDSDPSIIKEQFEKVLMNTKDGNTTEMDGILAEILKILGEDMDNLLCTISYYMK